MDMQKITRCRNVSTEDIRWLLLRTGSQIGSVWFKKRSDGSLRKMCYRLGVSNPSYANSVKRACCKYCGSDNCSTVIAYRKQKQDAMKAKGLMTVFDVNKVVRDREGNIVYKDGHMARGAWRTIPLDGVVRICVKGFIYEIEQ